jgi:peptidyl-tRNA hydrolase
VNSAKEFAEEVVKRIEIMRNKSFDFSRGHIKAIVQEAIAARDAEHAAEHRKEDDRLTAHWAGIVKEQGERIAKLEASTSVLESVIERDRSIFADCVTAIKKELESYQWLREGRGPYEWDDDKWHQEFAEAYKSIMSALEPAVKLAGDLSNSPKKWEEVQAARMTATEREQAAVAAALRELAEVLDKQECLPTCDSVMHDDLCPLVNPGNVLRARIQPSHESALDRIVAEIEDKWHRRWHRDTGIPCDGSREYCPQRTIADCSPGDVISGTPDGTIVLDYGITTWKPARAAAFIVAEKVRKAKLEISKHAMHLHFSVDDGRILEAKCACGKLFNPSEAQCPQWTDHILALPLDAPEPPVKQ